MNAKFVFSLAIRWLFLMPLVSAALAALIFLFNVEAVGLMLAYTFPFSLLFLVGICLFASLLITIKSPELFKNKFDKYGVSLGNAVILCWGLATLYDMFAGDSTIKMPNPSTPINGVAFVKPEEVVYPKQVVDEWEEGIWVNTNPICVKATTSSIDNDCPGSIEISFCWEMNASKDWGIKAEDCAQGMKTKRIFSKGITPYKVPWCRSYDSECLASFKVIEAKALKFK